MAYRLSPLAEQDLEEIWLYVAEDAGPATADRLIDAIVERFDLHTNRAAPLVESGRHCPQDCPHHDHD